MTKLCFHEPEKCEGHHCPFHNPSDHHMKDWKMVLRSSGLIERVCKHGVGHPDPDSAAFLYSCGAEWIGIHGCDGCCTRPKKKKVTKAQLKELLEEAYQGLRELTYSWHGDGGKHPYEAIMYRIEDELDLESTRSTGPEDA